MPVLGDEFIQYNLNKKQPQRVGDTPSTSFYADSGIEAPVNQPPVSSSGSFYKDSGIEDPTPRTSIAEDLGDVGEAGSKGFNQLKKALGQAAVSFTQEGSRVSEAGKEMINKADTISSTYDNTEKNRGLISEALLTGVEAAPLALAAAPLAATAPLVGAATAGTLSAVGSAALFGGSDYQDKLKQSLEAGLSEEDAKKAALSSALIQGGGEFLANKATLGLSGILSKGIGKTIAEATGKGAIKRGVVGAAKNVATEMATESAQDLGSKAALEAYGVKDDQSYSDVALESAKGALGLSAILGTLGLHSHYKNVKQAQAIDKVFNDPTHSPEERRTVVQKVYNDIAVNNKQEADAWLKGAQEDIANNKPIRRNVDGSASTETINPETNQTIQTAPVKQAVKKFEEVFTKSVDTKDENYVNGLNAIRSNLQQVISTEEQKNTPDNIKLQEAKDALSLVENAHQSRIRTEEAERVAREKSQEVKPPVVQEEEEVQPTPTAEEVKAELDQANEVVKENPVLNEEEKIVQEDQVITSDDLIDSPIDEEVVKEEEPKVEKEIKEEVVVPDTAIQAAESTPFVATHVTPTGLKARKIDDDTYQLESGSFLTNTKNASPTFLTELDSKAESPKIVQEEKVVEEKVEPLSRSEEITNRLNEIEKLVSSGEVKTLKDKAVLRNEAKELISEKFKLDKQDQSKTSIQEAVVQENISTNESDKPVKQKRTRVTSKKERVVKIQQIDTSSDDKFVSEGIVEFDESAPIELDADMDFSDTQEDEIVVSTPNLTPIQEAKHLKEQLRGVNRSIIDSKNMGLDTSEDLAIRQAIKNRLAELESQGVILEVTTPSKERVVMKSESTGDFEELRFSLSDIQNYKPQVKIDHAANREVFNKIKEGLRKSVLKDIELVYVEDFETFDWSPYPFGMSDSDKITAKGVFKRKDGKGYIAINGKKFNSTLDMVKTIAHELIGHYGIRKLFDTPLGNKYDQFLVSMLNNKDGGLLKHEIIAHGRPWFGYLETWKKLNVPNYSNLSRAEQKVAYRSFMDKLPPEKKVTFQLKEDGRIIQKEMPVDIAAMLADEYMAELAAAHILDQKFVNSRVGIGTSESLKRSTLRNARARWLDNMIRKVKHLFKSFFGNSFDVLTKEDLTTAIAESYDSLFEVINPAEQFFSDKPFAPKEIIKLEDDQTPAPVQKPSRPILSRNKQVEQEVEMETPAMYSLSEDQIVNKFTPFSFVIDEKVFSDNMDSNFGEIHKNARSRLFKKWDQSVRNSRVGRVFTTFRTLSHKDTYRAIQTLGKGYMDKVEQKTIKMAKALEGLSPLQNQIVFEYFTTKGADPDTFLVGVNKDSPVISNILKRNAIIEAKEAIRETGRFLVDSGVISKESYEANEDAYLHIQYLKYIDSYRGSGKKTSSLSFTKKRIARTEMEAMALGQIKDVKFLVPETYGVMARDHVLIEMFNTINKMSAKNKLHWVLTGPTHIKYGSQRLKVEEARQKVIDNRFMLDQMDKKVRNAFLAANQMDIDQFRQLTDDLDSLLIKQEDRLVTDAYNHALSTGLDPNITKEQFLKDNYIRMPESRKLGQLSNKLVRKEIANDLDVYTNAWIGKNSDNVEKFFAPGGTLERIHRFWKLSMIGLNPGSWIRNIGGNFSLLDLSTPTNKVKLIGMLHSEVTDAISGKPSKFWKLASEYGLFGATFSANELQDISNQYLDELKAAQDSYIKRSSSSWDSQLFFTDERFLAILRMAKHKTQATTSSMFSLLEGAFKTVSFRDYINRWEAENAQQYPGGVEDLSDELKQVLYAKAANHANESIFDYSQVPSWVKTLRRVPFGSPFLTFTYKAGPASIRAMVRNPIKFAEYATLPFLMTTISMMVNDWDDDDVRKMRSSLSDYHRFNPGTAFFPFRDSEGRPQIIGLDYLIPWAQYQTAMRKAYENYKDDAGESPTATTIKNLGMAVNELGFLGGPVPSAASAYINGRDSFTGKSIVTPGSSASNQMLEIMSFGANLMLPSWLDSTGWIGKVYNTLIDEVPKDRFGELKYTPGQAVSEITGFGTKPVLQKSGTFNREKGFEKRLKEVSDLKGKINRDRNLDPNWQDRALQLREANERMKMIRKQQQEELHGKGSLLDRF